MKFDLFSLLIYWSALAISLFLAKTYEKINAKNIITKIFWALLICFPLAFIAGIRYNVGTDFNTYSKWFNLAKLYPLNYYINYSERGFIYLITIISFLTNSNEIYFFIVEYLTLLFVVMAFFKLKKDIGVAEPLFIYYLLVYHASFNIMRQVLALSIIIFALSYLLEKKYKIYIILCLVASTIHQTSIICLLFVLYPLMHRFENVSSKINIPIESYDKKYYLKRFVFLLTYILLPYLFINYIKDLLLIADKLYLLRPNQISQLGVRNMLTVFYLFIPYFFYKINIIQKEKIVILFDILSFFIPIVFIGFVIDFAERLMIYPLVVLVFLIPLLNKYKKKLYCFSLIKLYYLLFCALKYFYEILYLNYNGTFPYFSNWF